MGRVLVAALVMSGLALLFASQAVYRVDVDGVAVITRGGDIVRVAEPGLQWRNPLTETAHHVATLRQYQQPFRVDAALKGSAPCRIE